MYSYDKKLFATKEEALEYARKEFPEHQDSPWWVDFKDFDEICKFLKMCDVKLHAYHPQMWGSNRKDYDRLQVLFEYRGKILSYGPEAASACTWVIGKMPRQLEGIVII